MAWKEKCRSWERIARSNNKATRSTFTKYRTIILNKGEHYLWDGEGGSGEWGAMGVRELTGLHVRNSHINLTLVLLLKNKLNESHRWIQGTINWTKTNIHLKKLLNSSKFMKFINQQTKSRVRGVSQRLAKGRSGTVEKRGLESNVGNRWCHCLPGVVTWVCMHM